MYLFILLLKSIEFSVSEPLVFGIKLLSSKLLNSLLESIGFGLSEPPVSSTKLLLSKLFTFLLEST